MKENISIVILLYSLFCSVFRSTHSYDVRVSKAYGSRGYDKVRISVISNSSTSALFEDPAVFQYPSQPFRFRWTENYLSSGLVSVVPGQVNEIEIGGGGETLKVRIPTENDGVRGILIADPCIEARWVGCEFGEKFQTLSRISEFLNTAYLSERNEDIVDFWGIIGDNFYDQSGELTSKFFDKLSDKTKSSVILSVPGNHDYWVMGSPRDWSLADQQANGFMQWYGMDVLASLDSFPYDFSVDPDSQSDSGPYNIPPASDFFFYHKLGNAAFVGFSGAYPEGDLEPHFREACSWLSGSNSSVVLLLGHWNLPADGALVDTERAFRMMQGYPECSSITHKIRYVMGHVHCNRVPSPNTGFTVGGFGQSGCGDFGFPVFDTHGGRFRVYYFSLATDGVFDDVAYESVISCLKEKGISECYSLATLWADLPLN